MNAQKIINIEDRRQGVNPQKENGYTAIANEIMDVLCKTDLSGGQRRCLDFIFRKTYGFNKKEDDISYSQFSEGTGISVRKVREHLKELSGRNIITMHENVHTSAQKRAYLPTTYCFNKQYSQWKEKTRVCTKTCIGMHENGKKVCTKTCNTKAINKRKDFYADSAESATEEFYKSKSGKLLKGKRLESFNRFWNCFDFKNGKAAAADSWIKIPQLTNSLVDQICEAAKIEALRRPEIIKRGATPKWAQGWITERRWEDESYSEQKQPQQKREYLNIPGVEDGGEI